MFQRRIQVLLLFLFIVAAAHINAETGGIDDYSGARWDPLHFHPEIETAKDEQCLGCHQNILDDKPLNESPAGQKASESLAWYQTLSTYQGEQDTFHRRHLNTEYAQNLMSLKCNTCHQGIDPREEVSDSSATGPSDLTMRKQVDPYICTLCHGQNNFKKMGMPEPWPQSSKLFGNSCMTCHVAIKTERHKGITFLKAENIEKLGAENADVCFGCHGGRAWYRIWFPYSERQWPGWGLAPLGARHKYIKAANDAQATGTKNSQAATTLQGN